MGLFGDDDYDDIYPADPYPEYDFDRDGHIDAFEATEITAEGFEDQDLYDDPASELESFGLDVTNLLAMSDAEKYKFFQEAVTLDELDYTEYFDVEENDAYDSVIINTSGDNHGSSLSSKRCY